MDDTALCADGWPWAAMSDHDEREDRDYRSRYHPQEIDPFTQLLTRFEQFQIAIERRTSRLEYAVYGFCGVIVLAVVGTWLALAGLGGLKH